MALTVFRFIPVEKNLLLDEMNAFNQKILTALNSSGQVYLTHTKVDDQYVIRMVTAQTYIEQKHVDKVIELIKEMGATFCV